MAQNSPKSIKWAVPEYRAPQRSRRWYWLASLVIIVCLFFSFFSLSGWKLVFLGSASNFLFALIIVVAAIIMIINESQPPIMVPIELGPEGVRIGNRFYDYDDFRHFAVLYKPKQSLKILYLEFKNSLRPRLSVPLRRQDALAVRNFLVRFLDEDLERTEPPLSEQLTKMLKL